MCISYYFSRPSYDLFFNHPGEAESMVGFECIGFTVSGDRRNALLPAEQH